MTKKNADSSKNRVELLDLRERLAELEDTLGAIRSGEVDALVVNGPNGDQVYSLKGAEQPYRNFIEQMGEGAVTLDLDGTILYCNRRFAEMINTPLERVISKSFLSHVAAADREVVGGMLADKKSTSTSITLSLKKGKKLPVRIAMNSFDTGNTTARCAVITDLTSEHERKMLSDALIELRASQAELKKQYLEVQQTRAKLEAASAAKDEFLAALSHELRTPLTPVLLAANALAVDSSLPAELRRDLDMIRRNVELEARLIDDLLDLTRIASGKLSITPDSTDLHETLLLALDICQSDTLAKRLRFDMRLNARISFVRGEAVRLQQIFWNLIRNAVKFTPSGGTISVVTRNSRSGRKPVITISIADNGIGIESDTLARIFDAFEQGSSEVTRRFGGLGLGLTISKRLVELHGGTITAASGGKNKGSTFVITLPAIARPVGREAGPAAGAPPKPLDSLRILLVEDHDDTRRNMARLLSALNHTVIPAASAAAALKLAGESSFDLVVSDIGLPDESGLDLMKKLRQRHNLRGICLSGYGMEEDIAQSRAAGFSEHLIKPINFQRLETAIALVANGTTNGSAR